MSDTRKILEIGNSSELSTIRARIGELEAENARLTKIIEAFGCDKGAECEYPNCYCHRDE